MAITLTDEMRAAVHAEDCTRNGHDFAFENALTMAGGTPRPDIGAKDQAHIPHLSCRACGRVWLVLEDVGTDYADAEAKLKVRLKDPTQTRVKPAKG